ncbi:hypothetical protein [Prevotella intermedia]|uniref:Uncharacterized protein n=1 Tax=Prevotella intermedia TaxID=28131 RepID=A0A2D3NDG6_PREIN|nr:hypothetical protein [Prevotella intermedia]ATV53405.1 hypothetical protein CTM50_10470 [Prevotella intermedia]
MKVKQKTYTKPLIQTLPVEIQMPLADSNEKIKVPIDNGTIGEGFAEGKEQTEEMWDLIVPHFFFVLHLSFQTTQEYRFNK